MLYREIIAACSEIHTKHKYTMRRLRAEFCVLNLVSKLILTKHNIFTNSIQNEGFYMENWACHFCFPTVVLSLFPLSHISLRLSNIAFCVSDNQLGISKSTLQYANVHTVTVAMFVSTRKHYKTCGLVSLLLQATKALRESRGIALLCF
jgi:hypothetical protein